MPIDVPTSVRRRVCWKLWIAALTVLALPAATTAQQPDATDTRDIHSLSTSFCEAFNQGQADKIAQSFAEQGCITDVDGVSITGRAAIQERFATTFRDNPGIQIKLRSKSLRMLSPDVAMEDGEAIIRYENQEEADAIPEVTAPYSVVYVKQDGRWLRGAIRDYPQLPAESLTPRDHLKELDWMTGKWMEEGPAMVSTSTCEWDENGNFLVWRYRVQSAGANAAGGTTFMGWDPRTAQIRSWLFDADGGHGEATWTRIDHDQWLVKASGVLADGRTASATQYVKRLSPDRMSWTSFDREVGGVSVADISEYVLVRVPPQPKPASPDANR